MLLIPHLDLILGLLMAGSGLVLWLTVPAGSRQRSIVYCGLVAVGLLIAFGSMITNLLLGR